MSELLDRQNVQLGADPLRSTFFSGKYFFADILQAALFLDFFSVDEYVLNGKVKAASYEKPEILGPYGQVGRLRCARVIENVP